MVAGIEIIKYGAWNQVSENISICLLVVHFPKRIYTKSHSIPFQSWSQVFWANGFIRASEPVETRFLSKGSI